MTADPKASIYRKDPAIVSRRIMDEVILVPIGRSIANMGSVFTLNETGAFIWNLIDGKKRVTEIREELLQQFDAPAERLEEDLTQLLDQLREIGAITDVA